jgi:hypothetical protein
VAEERKKDFCVKAERKKETKKCGNKCILVIVFITRWAEL